MTDWLDNQLVVTGPLEAVKAFMEAAEGPGFVDWGADMTGLGEEIEARLLQGGAPSLAAAGRVAQKLTTKFWWLHETARTQATFLPRHCPLDLNSLVPIPQKILRAGYAEEGRGWLLTHWGTEAPLRRIERRFDHILGSDDRLVARCQYDFLSADWSPWQMVQNVRVKWPNLTFDLKPFYHEPEIVPYQKARAA